MKSIFVFFAFLIGVCTSCDSILEISDNLDESGALYEKGLFSSEENIEGVLNGVYAKFASQFYNGGSFFQMTSSNTPYFSSGGPKGETFTDFDIPTELTQLFQTWVAMYECIDSANQFIESIAIYAADMPSTPTNLGQAHFLRALTYFDLVRVWGEVPLRIEPANKETLFFPKSSKKEIYDQIISDLTEAKRLLPSEVYKIGRPRSYAASGYLAKVYMEMATEFKDSEYWNLAYEEAISVVGQYELVDSYAELFQEGNKNTEESIFEIQYSSTGTSAISSQLTTLTAPGKSIYNKRRNGGALRINKMAFHDHYKDYGIARDIASVHPDTRIAATYISESFTQITAPIVTRKIYPLVFGGTGVNYLKKYQEETNTNINSGRNRIMFRYADLLLMLAEIENERGNISVSKSYVKEVLDRADSYSNTLYELSNIEDIMSVDDLRERILIERIYELLGEGHEWFDLRRQTIGGVLFLENRILRRQELMQPGGDDFAGTKKLTYGSIYNKDLQFILDDPSILEKNMRFPIPIIEILGNNALNFSDDQNIGY